MGKYMETLAPGQKEAQRASASVFREGSFYEHAVDSEFYWKIENKMYKLMIYVSCNVNFLF